ncbi:MAG: PQQ-binding-like beta-propeller repeat protein [Calditrichia bacterium]
MILRKHRFFSPYTILIFIIGLLSGSQSIADDWPQWRGPERNGASQEKDLLKTWPDEGPALLWSKEGIGTGFSSVSIAKGRLYINGAIDKQETLTALDLDGNIQWQTTYGSIWKGSYPEARTTSTVDGDQIFVISGMGKVVCINASSGEIKWSVHAYDDFDGEYHEWGIAESPLVFDNKVICTPGGREASVVALDKNTGSLIWQSKTLSEIANYCSPILINRGGKKIIATQLMESFVGLNAADGSVLWRDEYSDYQDDPADININSPLYHDGFIFVTSGYDDGSAMYELSTDGTKIKRKWVDETLDVHVGGVVRVDGYIYGANWENNKKGNWVCLNWNTGKVMYEKKWFTKGSIITADGMLYCYEEKKGNLALVKANPEKYDKISSFKIPLGSGPHWAHPSISDGRLYVRHGDALMVYDIKGK